MTDIAFEFSRRSMLATVVGMAAALPLSRRVQAAEGAILRRAIPHGNGEMLPVIGVGTSRVFAVGDDESKRKVLRQVLDTLVAAGGNVVDTASSYGTAEEVVGAIGSGTPLRSKLFIASKLEARGGKDAEAEFATSLKRLKIDRMDLLQLHNVEDGDSGLGFYRDLKAAGKVRYIGATTTFKDGYGAMEKLIKQDKPDFIEIDCSIANRDAQDRIIPAAADVGAAVLIALPFGRTKLFPKVKGKPLPPVAKEIGAETWGQVFLKYLLGNPAITAVIPGTGDPKHMADNLAAGRGPVPDAKQRQALVDYFEGLG